MSLQKDEMHRMRAGCLHQDSGPIGELGVSALRHKEWTRYPPQATGRVDAM